MQYINADKALQRSTKVVTEFMHKTQGRLPMTEGWVQQDQFKWLWSRSRANNPYQYDQTSGQLPTLET